MSGELTSLLKDERHPWDWYVEQRWVTKALIDHVDFSGETVWDPFCGLGNVVAALTAAGIDAFGSDIDDRSDDHRCYTGHDFLGDQHALFAFFAKSLVFNPPFSYQDGRFVKGLAERIVRKAIGIATHKVAALLPVKWLASGARYHLFNDFMPAGIYILCERPSMPPGNKIAEMGARAWKRGKIDYMWVVWDKQAEPLAHAPTHWIAPRPKADRV